MIDQAGRQQLSGYVMRDYGQVVSALYQARLTKRITLAVLGEQLGCHLNRVSIGLRGDEQMRGGRLFEMAHALGYDLALVPREDA